MATTIRANLCPVVVASRNHCTAATSRRKAGCRGTAATLRYPGLHGGAVRLGHPVAAAAPVIRTGRSGPADQDAGQAFSMSSRTCAVGLSVAIQLVSSVHSAPAPTSPGIRSEPSKRKTAPGSWKSFAASWSIGDARFSTSSPVLALTQPGPETLALTLAQSADDR